MSYFSKLLILLTHAHAQKGSILVYGAVAYSSISENQGGSTKATAFTPGIGYQFSDAFTAGLDLQLAHTNDGGGNTADMMEIGPFLRYTKTISDIFSIYGQMDVHYDHNTVSSSVAPAQNGFDFKLFPAVFVNIKNGFGLNFDFGGLEYQSLTQKFGGQNLITNTFAFTFGEGITVGISKNFGGKKR